MRQQFATLTEVERTDVVIVSTSRLDLNLAFVENSALVAGSTVSLGGYEAGWDLQRELLKHLEKIWREPDEGLWEIRGPR